MPAYKRAAMPAYIREDLKPMIAATPEQTTWDIAALRRGGEELLGGAAPDLGGAELAVAKIAGGEGQPLEIRTLSPGAGERKGTLQRVIYSIHGGGYVAGKAEYDDPKHAELAQEFHAEVISPEYRLAPEHPWPAGLEDCLAGLEYAAGRAAALAVPLYIFGDSAGGGLAYFAALLYSNGAQGQSHFLKMQRKLSANYPISGTILLEPCLDPRMDTDPFDRYSEGPIWNRKAAAEAWRITAVTPESRAEIAQLLEDPQLAAQFPPSIIIVNPVDPLRDEGIALARHLVDCGVPAELHMYAGSFHGALSVPGNQIWAEIQAVMRRFFGRNV